MATTIKSPVIVEDPAPISSSRPFLVTGSAAVWIVNEGAVDLFLQRTAGGEVFGPRHHLMRVPAGEAVFGITPDPTLETAVIACPAPASSLSRMTSAALHYRACEFRDESAMAFMEKWIARLAQAAAANLIPKKAAGLRPDQKLECGETGQFAAPVSGVVWVRHSKGQSSFLGKKEREISGSTWFPVSPFGWIKADGGAVLQCASTRTVAKADPEFRGMDDFHATALACCVANWDAEEARDGERLTAKWGATQSAVRGAITRLASALDRSSAGTEDRVDQIPIVSACKAVGKEMGIAITDVPDAMDKSRHKDPVMAVARASSVRARRVLLKDDWWKADAGSLVGFRHADNQPVALLRRSASGYQIYDPVEKTYQRVDAAAARTLSGIAYTLYRPFPAKALCLKDLLQFGLAGCRREMVFIVLMGLMSGLLGLITPIAMGAMFDSAIPGAQRDQVTALAAFLIMSAFCSTMFSITRGIASLRLQGRLDATLQAAAWDRVLRLPPTFFRKFSSGDLAMRSMAFKEIGQVLSGPALSLILTQTFSMLSFGLLFVYDWRLAMVGTGLIVSAIIASSICLRTFLTFSRQVTKLRGQVVGIVMELLGGVAKFRVSGTEGKAFAVWARAEAERKRIAAEARRSVIVLNVFNSIWPVVSAAVVFYFASDVFGGSEKTMSTGTFLAFLTVFNQVLSSALWLAASVQPVLGIVPLYERAKPILETLPESDAGKSAPGDLKGLIEVNRLTFRYSEDGPTVLKELSFQIRAGEMVAIVGSSGCGKSTLFRLLLGFEKPVSGSVYYDGQDLAGLDLQAVREQMGVVLQNGKLGSGTMFDLIVGSLPLTLDHAWEAARMTGLDKDISAMPMGMHTAISEGGTTLSGGQRQRLMIASAIVNRPRILLFDEATSALDNETQSIVTRSLESLRATRVVIAHRLSTVVKADRILVFDKGSIVQSGTYDELIAQEGLFKELAIRQLA